MRRTDFILDAPEMYKNMGDIYFEKRWVSEAREILDEGLRRFPEDEGIKGLIERIDDETDDQAMAGGI